MKYRRIILFCYIAIILIFMCMCGISYAYFSIDLNGNEDSKDINFYTLSDDIEIIYTDTSNVSMVNAYTGDKLTKTFTVNNNGNIDLYYDLFFDNVVNNFEDNSDLVYTLSYTSNNGAYVKEKEVPTTNENIATNVLIKHNETHEYILEVTFLKKDIDQSNNMNKTFSSNINIKSSSIPLGKNLFDENTLGRIIEDSLISSEKEIDLTSSNENGVYSTNSSINGNTIYFYRGNNNLKNNVILGNNCYKIIRTTSDNGIRLIYNGVSTNNKCNDENSYIDILSFNNESSFNTYVGYMYGGVNSSNYENEHSNTSSSAIKILLDSWYSTNISYYDNYISKDTIYCNNRKTKSFVYKGISYGLLGYSNNNTGYKNMYDIINNSKINLDCENINDKYSVNSGNKKLINSIGLITGEELYYAGFINIKNNYLYTNYDYWTLSPAYYNGSGAYNIVASAGKLNPALVTNEYAVRPVITIKKDLKVSSGDGSNETPYTLVLE